MARHRGRRLAVAPHALLPLGLSLISQISQALALPVEVEVVVEVLERRERRVVAAVAAAPFVRPLQLLKGEGRGLVMVSGNG